MSLSAPAMRPGVLGCRDGEAHQLPEARAGFDDPASVHDVHPVSERGNDTQVVANQDQRKLLIVNELSQEGQYGRLHRDIQGCRGLLGHEHLRAAGESDGQCDPLTQPAGELVRSASQSGRGGGHPHQLE